MRLLLVEDDARIARFVAKGLREQAYAVDVTASGDDALYEAAINSYDVVILDVMIPGRNGFEVCRELRRAGQRMPILMLTARDAVGVVGREEIAEHVWDESFDPFSNFTEVYVNRLRRKIDVEGSKALLHTRRGAGYFFGVASEAAEAQEPDGATHHRGKGNAATRKSHA